MDSGSPRQLDVTARNIGTLDQMLRQCCLELLLDYGVPAVLQHCPDGPSVSEPTFCAAIDFNGPQLRGRVTLKATQSVIRESALAMPGMQTATERTLLDWACEITNQLVGRLKNKLRRYAVSVDVALPRPLDAARLPESAYDACARLSCAHGSFAGYLGVHLEPGFLLVESESTAELPNEGDTILF